MKLAFPLFARISSSAWIGVTFFSADGIDVVFTGIGVGVVVVCSIPVSWLAPVQPGNDTANTNSKNNNAGI
jgi:hypothetical protein